MQRIGAMALICKAKPFIEELGGAGGEKSVQAWRKWNTALPLCALYRAGRNACPTYSHFIKSNDV